MRKLLIALFLALGANSMYAGHVFGGEMWYKYIGDTSGVPHHYMVYLRLYSDRANLASAQNIQVTSSCFGAQTLTADFSPPQGYIQDSLGGYYLPEMRSCDDDSVGNFFYDLYVHQYQKAVILPGTCSDFTFSYSVCCRASNISNIPNPSAINLDIDATLNNTLGTNTSPRFLAAPTSKYCNMVEHNVSHRATHEQDSIYYKLSPINGVNSMAYSPGYSYQQPIQSVNGVSLNPQTGTLSFTSSQTQVVVLRINAVEYSYDSSFGLWFEVGYSTREMMYFTGNCVNLGAWEFVKDTNGHDTAIVPMCGDTTLVLSTEYPYDPSTLAGDGSDFLILDHQGNPSPVISATAVYDPASGMSSKIKLDLYLPLDENGTYSLMSKVGTDMNTLKNTCGYPLISNDTVSFVVADCNSSLGIKEARSVGVELYPSPAHDALHVKIPESMRKLSSSLYVYNTNGQVVQKRTITAAHEVLDVTDLPSGMYVLVLSSSEGTKFLKKFLKD